MQQLQPTQYNRASDGILHGRFRQGTTGPANMKPQARNPPVLKEACQTLASDGIVHGCLRSYVKTLASLERQDKREWVFAS